MGLVQDLSCALGSTNYGKISKVLEKIDSKTLNEADGVFAITPLHLACWFNNVEAVAKLLSFSNINVNSKSAVGVTAIMVAAANCNSQALKLMLDDPRVDLKTNNDNGEGLEDVVGTLSFKSTEKAKCLYMITKARSHAKSFTNTGSHVKGFSNTGSHVKGFSNTGSHVKGFSNTGNSLEELRTNVRKQYIKQMHKVNTEIEEKEKKIRFNMELKLLKKKRLMVKQHMEKESLAKESQLKKIKLKQEKSLLEKTIDEIQQKLVEMKQELTEKHKSLDNIRKSQEEMTKNHKNDILILEDKFEKQNEKIRQDVANLNIMTDQLAKDLQKLDSKPDNDASANLEAAKGTLECPVCMERMEPPVQIWMCSLSHLVCEPCKNRLNGKPCPTCRTEGVTRRAFMAENFARTLFHY